MADETKQEADEQVAVVEDSVPIAYYYDASANKTNAFFPGVPRGAITQEQCDALPKWLQRSIAASPMYVSATPATEKEGGDSAAKPKAKKAQAKE